MMQKGYDFPLLSLDLLPPGATPAEPRFALLLPAGRLVVRAELRRRAASFSTLALCRALARALGWHRVRARDFARFGLDDAWAAGVRHWRGRLLDLERRRLLLDLRRDDAARALREAGAEGRRALWRLGLSARLAGLGGLVTAGRAPKAAAALDGALAQAAERARPPLRAALLARHGFGEEERAALLGAQAALAGAREEQAAAAEDLRGCQAEILTVRGALLGDLARLCQAAPAILAPELAAQLRLEPLLGVRRPR